MEVMDSLMETQPSQALGSCHLKPLKPPAIPFFLPLRYINGVLYYIILFSFQKWNCDVTNFLREVETKK